MKRPSTSVLSVLLIAAVIFTACVPVFAGAAGSAPRIGSACYGLDAKNEAVRWVQKTLKETGIWYQGDEWKVTGHVGKHTMQEVKSFMETRGYSGHSGAIDQTVIDELDAYICGQGPTGGGSSTSYDISVPQIGSAVYGYDANHSSIRWVQEQLKATGIWYQGDEWKVTGHLGKHTMQEISRFMETRGYYGHPGSVTQQVIDELYYYLHGNRTSGTETYGSYDSGD